MTQTPQRKQRQAPSHLRHPRPERAKRHHRQLREEFEEEQERLAAERRQRREEELQRQQEEHEAEQAQRNEVLKARTATFERIVANSPATMNATQLPVLLRALVNLDTHTFADDLAEEIAGDNENEERTAEEVLLSAIDTTADDQLTRFALRLALTGHLGIPREGETDFLIEAATAFAPQQPKKTDTRKEKKPTPIKTTSKPTPIKAASKPTPNKKTAKKRPQPKPRGSQHTGSRVSSKNRQQC